MNSRMVLATVRHARVAPVRHTLEYPVWLYVFDLDELPVLDRDLPGFGYNRFAPVSIYDRDYLDRGPGTIREKLVRILGERGVAEPIGQVLLVTSAAWFRYVFNPVSFYYCFLPGGELGTVVAEVNNVVGDRHVYVMPRATREARPGFVACHTVPKAFHVSPFNPVAGYYELRFTDPRERLEAHVDLHRDTGLVMTASVGGTPEELTPARLRAMAWRFPLLPWLSIPRILKEAAILYFRRKLTFHARPVASSTDTIRVRAPSRFQRATQQGVESLFGRIGTGSLRYRAPEGDARVFGTAGAEPSAQVEVRDYAFYPRVALGGDVGFGEAYMAGEWNSPDVAAVVGLMIENRQQLTEAGINPVGPLAWWHRHIHGRRGNTRDGSRANIRDHYDLSNDFFRRFLDPTMTYSSAVYERPDLSLEQAQRCKMDRILRRARVTRDSHVLEIGCGWGGFALHAAHTTGCRVTGITISNEQHALATERVREAGLEDRVRILHQDYRDVAGQYDAIVSIEMLEAVGHGYLGTFFRTCDSLLARDGLVVLQVITIPDQRYDDYRRRCDWIQKHIFPGGMLPSLTALCEAMTRESGLIVEHLENIGVHYARTLRDWRDRFLADPANVAALAQQSVLHRKWLYYLGYCEAAFATRTLEDLILVLTRPGNRRLPGVPGRESPGA